MKISGLDNFLLCSGIKDKMVGLSVHVSLCRGPTVICYFHSIGSSLE